MLTLFAPEFRLATFFGHQKLAGSREQKYLQLCAAMLEDNQVAIPGMRDVDM
jgi:hypothetical protein